MHVAAGSNATRSEFCIRTVDFQITVITRNVHDSARQSALFYVLWGGRKGERRHVDGDRESNRAY